VIFNDWLSKFETTFEFVVLAQNINRIGAVGGFASEPAFGLVRLELWQILTFWFFWVKPKERRKEWPGSGV